MLSIIKSSIIWIFIIISFAFLNNLGVLLVIDEIVSDSNSRSTIKKVKKDSNLIMRLTRLCMWNMKTTRPATLRCWILISCFIWFILCPSMITTVIISLCIEEYSSNLFVTGVDDMILFFMTFFGILWFAFSIYYKYLMKHRDELYKSRKRKK